jgi:plasmid stabilization system protein ParE
MIRIVVTPRVRRDRDDILRYLAREAGAGAVRKYAERFRDATLRLTEMPGSGSLRPELGFRCRLVVIAPYLLIYDYDPAHGQVTLLRILHGKRGITERLLRR